MKLVGKFNSLKYADYSWFFSKIKQSLVPLIFKILFLNFDFIQLNSVVRIGCENLANFRACRFVYFLHLPFWGQFKSTRSSSGGHRKKYFSAYGFYHGIPAVLMDFILSSSGTGQNPVWGIFNNHISKLESNGFWILGESYSQINVGPKNETKCEKLPCYEKSLQMKKICKPGSLKIY